MARLSTYAKRLAGGYRDAGVSRIVGLRHPAIAPVCQAQTSAIASQNSKYVRYS